MIKTYSAYILDVYIENNEVILWLKTEDCNILRLIDEYEPSLYLLPKNDKAGEKTIQILSDLSVVSNVKWQKKFTSIFSSAVKKVIRVTSPSIHHYNLLLKALQHEQLRTRVNRIFNNHLSHIQRYLFTDLQVRPTTRVLVEFEDNRLISIAEVKDEDISSPFRVMQVEVLPSIEETILDADDPFLLIRTKTGRDATI